jgi:hypothetical protein
MAYGTLMLAKAFGSAQARSAFLADHFQEERDVGVLGIEVVICDLLTARLALGFGKRQPNLLEGAIPDSLASVFPCRLGFLHLKLGGPLDTLLFRNVFGFGYGLYELCRVPDTFSPQRFQAY